MDTYTIASDNAPHENVVWLANGRLSVENFDGENVDELIKICQIRQYFPPSKFCAIQYIFSEQKWHRQFSPDFRVGAYTASNNTLCGNKIRILIRSWLLTLDYGGSKCYHKAIDTNKIM